MATSARTVAVPVPEADIVDDEGVHYFGTGYHSDFVSAKPGQNVDVVYHECGPVLRPSGRG